MKMATPKLKTQLERLYKTYDITFLSSDPLEFVHRFKDARDREIAGFIASSLASGRVAGIKRSVETVLALMNTEPYRFTINFKPEKHEKAFSGFIHRFNNGDDVACLLWFARQMIEEKGSSGGFFERGYSKKDINIKNALSSFSEGALSLDSSAVYAKRELGPKAGVRFFFPNPKDGSPCKRLNLYLRWMVRRGDRLDFGQWKGVDPASLVIPLDTHIARISQNIGLTKRTSPDWKMAEEVTEALRKLDPKDPIKYDFAICRLGILDRCPKKADRSKCASCLIAGICVL